jgi:hypothetical protein
MESSQEVASQIKYMICHDGSNSSKQAVDVVHHSLLRDIDHLAVAHAWSAEKEAYLKFSYKRDYLREQVKAEFISLGDTRFRYLEEEVESGQDTRNVL